MSHVGVSIFAFVLVVSAAPAVAGAAGHEAAGSADFVHEWNEILVSTVGSQNPFFQGRVAAITQLAVFESINAVSERYAPYLDGIEAQDDTSAEAAAVAAAHTALRNYVPASASALDAARASSLARIAEGAHKQRGIALGEAVANALIALRASDGSAPPAFHTPTSSEPGIWQPTPACPPAGGVFKHWGAVAPFAIPSAAHFRSPPPPPLASGRYARDFDEVKEIGAESSTLRPQAKADVARFYNVVLAVGVWNPALRQAAEQRGLSMLRLARLLALANMAIHDGLVSVMETKYVYELWRPETAIRAADRDGNAATEMDPGFRPFIPTPCFPSYGSAHAAASYGARRIAEAVFGDAPIEVVLAHPAFPGLALEYDSFEAITDDIDDARVYGGIHFRFDQRAGAVQGRRIGTWILRHALRPLQR